MIFLLADSVRDLPWASSLLGLITGIATVVIATGIVALVSDSRKTRRQLTASFQKMQEDIAKISDEVFGNPHDGEVGIREEVRRVRNKVDYMNGAP